MTLFFKNATHQKRPINSFNAGSVIYAREWKK